MLGVHLCYLSNMVIVGFHRRISQLMFSERIGSSFMQSRRAVPIISLKSRGALPSIQDRLIPWSDIDGLRMGCLLMANFGGSAVRECLASRIRAPYQLVV